MKFLLSIIASTLFLSAQSQLHYLENYPNGEGAGAYENSAAGIAINPEFDGVIEFMLMAHNLSSQFPSEVDSTVMLLSISNWGNENSKVICDWDSDNQLMLPTMLSYGDPINSSSNFYMGETQTHLPLLSYNPVTNDSIGNFTSYLDTNYVGLNCFIGDEEYFGWVRINVSLQPYDGIDEFPFIYVFEWAFCQDPLTAGEIPECAVVGTNEMTHGDELSIYPNPASNRIWLNNFNSVLQKDYQIIDPTGKVIDRGTIAAEEASIDVALLPTGVYFLQIEGIPRALRIIVDNQ